MHATRRNQAGESLIEILVAIVLILLTMSTLFYAFSSATSASQSQEDLVTANAILRDYAETTKTDARTACGSETAGAKFSASYALTPDQVAAGFSVNTGSLSNQQCPPVTGPADAQIATETLIVTLPNGQGEKALSIAVRTP